LSGAVPAAADGELHGGSIAGPDVTGANTYIGRIETPPRWATAVSLRRTHASGDRSGSAVRFATAYKSDSGPRSGIRAALLDGVIQ